MVKKGESRTPCPEEATRAAQAAVAAARPLEKNGYKVDIARVLVQRAILGLTSANQPVV